MTSSLSPGSRLGPYEVVAPIGAGGMGEVYKARDTRLDRTVAIKVLASHLSASPELRQRFEREAKAISSLTHPNICTLYDVGHQNGTDFLVMEFLEGETLADRLSRGPLPLEQVLKLGVEIASALDRAHRQGIVHRDLKPGNIVLTKGGAKLLDFGLAKIAGGVEAQATVGALTSLPTEMAGSAPLTQEGTLLGTFQYMAPEQLEGAEADARTDLFALGAVLYEMVTGRPAFQGKSRASLISAIMSSEPAPVTTVQPLTPPAFERVIRTSLAKDPDDRWQTAHDVKLQLQWIAEGGSQAGLPAPVVATRARRERAAWWVAAAAIGVAIGTIVVGARSRPAPQPTVRFTVPAPDGVSGLGLARISPDGRMLAFDAVDSTGRQTIWVRPLDGLEARSLPGTDGAGRPFWSPDSRMIAFLAGSKVKRVSVAGGPTEILGDTDGAAADGAWGSTGVILFDGAQTDALRRIPATGGATTEAVPADSVTQPAWPEFLPDGKHFLMVVGPTWELSVGELGKPGIKRLGIRTSRAEYSNTGHVLFVRDQTLMAQRFDARALALRGEPFPVAEQVTSASNAFANFSVSNDGVLAYRALARNTSHLAWRERLTGRELATVAASADLRAPAISPDGRRVVVRIRDATTGNSDLWIMDPARGTSTRFTFDRNGDNNPVWSPDGKQIAFQSNRTGEARLYLKSSSGLGEEKMVADVADLQWVESWSPDGKTLLVSTTDGDGLNLTRVPMTGSDKPSVFLKTPFNEGQSQFSPDGHWVAYTSDESGRVEVYVQSFDGLPGKWQISSRGGSDPHWSPDGKRLYYVGADLRLMAVSVTPGDPFEAGRPEPQFASGIQDLSLRNNFCVAPDGQLLFVVPDRQSQEPTTIVLNWAVGLRGK